MKKILCVCLSLFMIVTLFAEGRTFKKLGRFTDVKIVHITWKGIRIKHSKGSCYIKDKDLSKPEQQLLAKEIGVWKEKLAKHDRRVNAKKQSRAEQEKELDAFLKQLPKMNAKAICNWFQKNIGTTPYEPDFKVKFFSTYGFAKNKFKVMDACTKRLISIDVADFNALKEKCEPEPIAKINGIIRAKIGVPFTVGKEIHTDFAENLRVRYVWVPKNERAKFVKALKAKLDLESKCSICHKNPAIVDGGYGKCCEAKACTKCKKALADPQDKDKKDKLCLDCKGSASGDMEGSAGGAEGGNDAPPPDGPQA